MDTGKSTSRQRVIIHFDYDAFYASVYEAKDPALKSLPFAVQQKQIIVTCNFVARDRGLHKLQLIKEARRVCPEVTIALGEDLSIFRDASKELYDFIRGYSWSDKAERLGFDEVWLDVTDMVEHNVDLLNRHDLKHSFFQLARDDPTRGFNYDATSTAGHTYPQGYAVPGEVDDLALRLRLGSHLAFHIRQEMEALKGYTCAAGIATNKLLSKLVGTLHKPKGQTTMMPPSSNVTTFLDSHDIGKIPGIGFKLAQKLREYYLQRPADIDEGLVYGDTKEAVTVAVFRNHPGVSAESLEQLLAGPGFARGIGHKVWSLLHGDDDSEVRMAKYVPSQISIEDSYFRLDTMPELLKELGGLACSLLSRMRIDLLSNGDDVDSGSGEHMREREMGPPAKPRPPSTKKWLAHPKTIRLTTRPRMPLQPDGTRIRSFKRISHSAPLPNFVFSLNDSIDRLADKLVREHILHMFRKLHPERSGWNLSLVNLAVTNMAETAGNSKTANGRDIGGMFRRQDEVLREFRVTDVDDYKESGIADDAMKDVHEAGVGADADAEVDTDAGQKELQEPEAQDEDSGWDDTETEGTDILCGKCGLRLPPFAMSAHERFHSQAILQP